MSVDVYGLDPDQVDVPDLLAWAGHLLTDMADGTIED